MTAHCRHNRFVSHRPIVIGVAARYHGGGNVGDVARSVLRTRRMSTILKAMPNTAQLTKLRRRYVTLRDG